MTLLDKCLQFRTLNRFFLFSLCLFCSACTHPQQSISNKVEHRPHWWFPTDIAVGKDYEYHCLLNIVGTCDEKVGSLTKDLTFIVSVSLPEDESPGRILRLESIGLSDDPQNPMVKTFRPDESVKLRLADNGIFFNNKMLLQSPFREGDRQSILLCIVPFFDYQSLIAQTEVVAVEKNSVRLKIQSWANSDKIEYIIPGELCLQSDSQGLVSAHLSGK